MSMWQKDSPEPMENSSGYVSNSNSMNPPVKYATIGRKQPGGVKRTSSLLVPQPQPPASYKANPIPKPKCSLLSAKDARRPFKNELNRPSSRASKSSYNSGSGMGMGPGRPTSRGSRDSPSGKISSRRSGPRASHHKLRRPESRASSKALILRRRESTTRGKSSNGGSSSARQSTRAGSRPSSRGTPSTSGSHRRSPGAGTTSKSSFFSWKPKLTLKRSKSMQTRKNSGKQEIRFGDETQSGVLMMRGVERRRPEGGPLPLRRPANGDLPRGLVSSQTLPRPPRHVSSPERARRTQRAVSVDMLEDRRAGAAVPSGSPSLDSRRPREKQRLRSSRSVSPIKARPPSELSSSPAPRAPIWRADSDGSLSETVTNLSALTESRTRASGSRSQRPPDRPAGKPTPKASDKPSVIDFIRRKLSIKPKEKPLPVRMKPSSSRRRERASSSSSSPERARPIGRLRPAKSIDVLTAESRPPPPGQEDEKRYMSLPRGKRRSSGTTLSRKLSNMGWGTLGRTPAGRDRDARDQRGPRNPRDHRDPRDPKGLHGPHTVSLREGRTNVLPHIMPEPERPAPDLPRSMSQPAPEPEPEPDVEPPVPPKMDTSSLRRRPVSPQEDEPIQPILQDRRAISQSQPSLLFPREEPHAPEEPFTLYANLPFQLPVRLPGSPEPGQRAANAASLKAKRAMSQPSLLEPPAESPRPPSPPRRSPPPYSSADRSDTIYAYSPHRRGRPPPQRPQTRTVWRPNITVKRRGILKGRKTSGGEGESAAQPASRQQGVLHGIANNIRSVFKHKKNGDGDRGVPEGYVAVPGGAVVSERFTNITNTHEERDDVREEEEVHHLGQYSNEEISRAIRDGKDARALVRHRQGSGPPGQLVDPRSGQRRLVHQAGKTWRTVDTEDIHEKTRQDEHGELITETARTAQQEQFQNVMVPEDGSDCSAQEQHRTTSQHRRHVKDEDMLEYYSVPKGGRLGDGIKLGEGLRYVQENVEEDREGDDNIESLSERMRRLRQLGYKPEGQTLAKTPIEYQEEEKTRRKETHKWLDCHFGSESEQSGSSEDGESRRRAVQGRDEVDRHQTGSYEYQKSSNRRTDQAVSSGSWQRGEKYSKEVRRTPEHTYVKETRQGPRGDFERVQVTPVGSSPAGRRPSLVSTDTRGESEDPIFASKFSSGKPRGNVRFQATSPERRQPDSGRLSPPTQSPPPPPPPRHRKKGRDKDSPFNAPPDNHYASSPIRERYERDLTPGRSASDPRRDPRDQRDGYPIEERRGDRRQVKEYHFRSDSPRGAGRDNTSGSRYEYREQRGARHGSYSDERDGSQRRYAPEPPRGRERTASIDELSSSRPSDSERRVRYHHHSTDFLDRRGSDDRRAAPERVTFESQTLPRKPHDYTNSSSSRTPDTGRFGGSLINVSLKSNSRGSAPQKPARSPVQRSNSLYSKDGQDGKPAYNAGLKSPDIISKIQRTASMRRGEGEPEGMSHTSSSSRSYRASPAAPPPGKKDSFMRGLMKNAPELYNVLHGNERKDSKTPSPRSGLITPPPPLERVQPAGSGSGTSYSRSDRPRTDESRSGRSYASSEDAFRGGDRPSVVKVNVRGGAGRDSPRGFHVHMSNGDAAAAGVHHADAPSHYRFNDEIYTSPARRGDGWPWSEERSRLGSPAGSTGAGSGLGAEGGSPRSRGSPARRRVNLGDSPVVARVRAWDRTPTAAPT